MNVLRRPGPVQTVVLCLISIIAMTGTLWVLYSAIQLTSDPICSTGDAHF